MSMLASNTAVMLSIQPKWCELIASGKKTIEVRKTKPKLKTPFKCYIYCTKGKQRFVQGGVAHGLDDLYRMPSGEIRHGYSEELICCGEKYTKDNFLNGKVIGEFVCDEIKIRTLSSLMVEEDANRVLKGTCLTKGDIYRYLNIQSGQSIYDQKHKVFCLWSISDLVIYDAPKKLREYSSRSSVFIFSKEGKIIYKGMTRPPQSWCYVEEVSK